MSGGMRDLSRHMSPDAGFTVVEILMATVIMLIIAMGVIATLSFSAWATAGAAQRTKALNIANQYIEKARNLPYDQMGTNSDGGVYGDPPGDIHTPDVIGDFGVESKISWQRDANGRSQYKNIEVTVTWAWPISGSVKLTTSVFGKTDLTNVGDLALTLLDHDTNLPLGGVLVTVVPQGTTQPRSVRTGANGVAFFGTLPTGQASVTMASTVWVFDTTVPADVPVISVATGDVLSNFTIKGQKPSSLRVQVVGTHGDGLPGANVSTVVMGQTVAGSTDANGYVTFTMLPQGTYAVTAALAGRQTTTGPMVVPTPTPTSQPVTGSITLQDPSSIIRVNVTKTGGGAFPYVVPISVDSTVHNSVNGTWDFVVSELRTYSVHTSYTDHRPFSMNVAVAAFYQVVPVTALLDDLSNMTVQVSTRWGLTAVSAASVTATGPKTDTVSSGSTGLAAFTSANSHALYGTNQAGDSPYTVTVSKTGYDTATLSPNVSLVPGQTLSPNPVVYLVTNRTGKFVITTRKSSNNTLRTNARIRITGPTGSPDGVSSTSMDFTSGANGQISLDYLPLGGYTFAYWISGTNYGSVTLSPSGSPKTLSSDGQSQTFDVKW